MGKGKKVSSIGLMLSHLFVLSTYTSFRIHDHMLQSSSQVHTKNQIINWNRSLQQRMFTCISIRSNYLAKHPSPVSAPQVHWRFKTITKLLVKFCIDKPSQYFIFCPSTYNKSLVPFLWPLVNCFTTSWNVLWVGESLGDWQSSYCCFDYQKRT